MSRTTIWTLVLSLALASAAGAGPTAEEKCQAVKLNALGKRKLCLRLEQRKGVLGKTPDPAKWGDNAHFEDGFVEGPSKNADCYVRAVRGGS